MKQEDQNQPPASSQSEIDSRHRILAAALEEFAEHGAGGARVDRIARSAGVNKALIYYYFDSKQRLYEEALKAAFTSFLQTVKAGIAGETDLEKALRTTAAHYLEVFINGRNITQLILRELADPDSVLIGQLARTIRESGVPMRLVGFLREGQDRGEVRPVDVRQAVVSFITMQIGFFLMRPLIHRVFDLDDDRQFMIDRKEAVIDLFLHGVKAR